MPRVARIVVPGVPHHITQRGNNRQDVFFVDDDRRLYLGLLAKSAARYGLQVLGYCLMTNHVHLVAVPLTAESLAKALGRTDFVYTQYIARRHRRSGHLWQNRFYSLQTDRNLTKFRETYALFHAFIAQFRVFVCLFGPFSNREMVTYNLRSRRKCSFCAQDSCGRLSLEILPIGGI
jgi:REP element-mobilizing transposase RayT